MEMEAVLPSGGSSRRRWSSRPPSSSRAAWTELRPSEGRGGPATSSSSPASRGGAGNGLAGPLRGGVGQIRWRSGDAARDGAPPPTPSSACGLSRGGAHSGGDSEEPAPLTSLAPSSSSPFLRTSIGGERVAGFVPAPPPSSIPPPRLQIWMEVYSRSGGGLSLPPVRRECCEGRSVRRLGEGGKAGGCRVRQWPPDHGGRAVLGR
ncbi:unnamed protein product [Urochloa humidicola]